MRQSMTVLPGKRVRPERQGEQRQAPASLMMAQQARPVRQVEAEAPVQQAVKAGSRHSLQPVQQGQL
jgi:hypothetical protein